MSIAEKLTIIAENQQAVYDAGFTAGQAQGGGGGYDEGFEAGQQESYDRFWDMYQQNGNRQSYRNGFAMWTDAWYDPKYPIVCGSDNVYTAEGLLVDATITDTKVPISIIGTRADAVFQDCQTVKTIRLLRFENVVRSNNTFRNCKALTDITFDGSIATAISFANSDKLTDASVQSIIDHLADLTGKTAQTLTLHKTVVANMTEAQKTAISAKNWTLAS